MQDFVILFCMFYENSPPNVLITIQITQIRTSVVWSLTGSPQDTASSHLTTALTTHPVSESAENLEKLEGKDNQIHHTTDSLICISNISSMYRSQVSQISNTHHPDILTYRHVYGFRLQPCEELSSEIDPFKVHVDPPSDFKPFPSHHLEWKR